MDISADKVYNTNQTDAPKKILMGMQIEDLPSSTFLYYYSLQFSNTKSIVKVETGIVTLISYRHYLKIVGNN
jgi:hypothetical protein